MSPVIVSRQGIGFSPEIETLLNCAPENPTPKVARGLASRLRLKQALWFDFALSILVARGLASRLRLKLAANRAGAGHRERRQGIGFSPEIETLVLLIGINSGPCRQGIGFSPEIETCHKNKAYGVRDTSPGDWLLA